MKKQGNGNYGLFDYIISVLDMPPSFVADTNDEYTSDKSADMTPLTASAESQAAYEIKNFMDAMPGGFLIYHADGNEDIIYANKTLVRMFGCDTLQELRTLTGNSFKGIVHPEDLDHVERSIAEQIAQSKYNLDYVEYRIRCKDGRICWVEDYGHFIHSEAAGDIFYVFIADSTEKKIRMNQEKNTLLESSLLREQHLLERIDQYDKELKTIYQEHLRRLDIIEGLSSAYDTILYVNLDSDSVKPYRLSSRVQSYQNQQDTSDGFTDLIDNYVDTWVCEEDKQHILQSVRPNAIRERLSGSNGYYVNYKVQNGGEIQYLQLRIASTGDARPVSQVVLGCRSVDDETMREMQQRKMFESAMKQATKANAAKNTFLANMSHDMRTPLNAIIGYSTLAKNYIEDSEKLNEYFTKIETSSGQLLHLINEILEISRIESGEIQIENTDCSLSDIMRIVRASMQPRADAKSIQLIFDDTQLRHPDICSDCQKLTTILTCLVSNAVKYTEHGGKIHVTAKELSETTYDSSTYQLSVEDTGIGIAKNYLEKIFEPFERVSNTTLSGIYGTGLGLTIVKNLIDLLGGKLEVDSTPGRGSCFTVTLTLCHPEPLLTLENAEDLVVMLLHQKKILLVDDNEINLEIETELLQQVGISVETAENGKIAVEKIAASAPGEYALILMDIQMPVMNGYDATRAIRKLEDPELSNIPIIALSANAFVEDRDMSRKSGMNAHMPKPVNIPQLLELIAAIITKL